ncbi:hypothetical protein Tco_0044810 [Tanacetum coccineum]
MSSSTHPIIVLSDSYIEDAFSSTNTFDYTLTLPDYSPASSRYTSSDPLEGLSKDLLALLTISHFHDDPYMKVKQAYNASKCPEEQIETILNHLDELPLERIEHIEDKIECHGNGRVTMALLPPTFLKPLYPDMINAQDIEHMILPIPPRDIEPLVGSPVSLSSSSSGSSSPVMSTTPPPDYPFDVSIFTELDNSLTSTSAALAITQAAIRKLVVDSIAVALEAQAANMANTDNTNRNT